MGSVSKMNITQGQLDKAHAVARSFADFLDREYALAYVSWVIRENARRHMASPVSEAKPLYSGIGSAERIEAVIDDALNG